MKKENINIFLYSFLIVIGIGLLYQCSSSVPQKEIGEVETEIVYNEDVRLNVKKVFSWINSMPGEKKRFHVTGELEILEYSNYNYQQISIQKVTVLQDKKMIFIFTPKIEEEIEKNKKNLVFSTVRGLLVNAALDQKKSIDLVILLNDGSEELEYMIPNVSMELAQ